MTLISRIRQFIRPQASRAHRIAEIVYINLDSRIDRRQHTEAQLKQFDIPFERFSAVAPNVEDLVSPVGIYHAYFSRSVPRIQNYLFNEEQSNRGKGVLGCYISHYEILRSKQNCDHIFMILEDDVHFTSQLLSILQNYIVNYFATVDWDMIRIIWSDEYQDKKRGLQPVCDRIFKFDNAHAESKFSVHGGHHIWGGSHFQIVNKGKALKILRYMDRDNVYAIDSVYSTNQLECYAVDVGAAIRVGDFGTDIPKR
jgi:GR25 family glycosyltransferase involved in LPS biosynthesis